MIGIIFKPLLLVPCSTSAYAILLCFGLHYPRISTLIWQAFAIMMTNSILCRLLKMFFIQPLNPALGIIDYAFPSGHMFAAASFYGYIGMHCTSPTLRILCTVAISSTACGLVLSGYHSHTDVICACLFAAAILPYQQQIISKSSPGTPHTGLALLPLCLLFICLLPQRDIASARIVHVWSNFGLLSGTLLTPVFSPMPEQQTNDPAPLHCISHGLHALLGAIWYGLSLYIYTNHLSFALLHFLGGYFFSTWALSTSRRQSLQIICNYVATLPKRAYVQIYC